MKLYDKLFTIFLILEIILLKIIDTQFKTLISSLNLYGTKIQKEFYYPVIVIKDNIKKETLYILDLSLILIIITLTLIIYLKAIKKNQKTYKYITIIATTTLLINIIQNLLVIPASLTDSAINNAIFFISFTSGTNGLTITTLNTGTFIALTTLIIALLIYKFDNE
jgi:hypothetical protein